MISRWGTRRKISGESHPLKEAQPSPLAIEETFAERSVPRRSRQKYATREFLHSFRNYNLILRCSHWQVCRDFYAKRATRPANGSPRRVTFSLLGGTRIVPRNPARRNFDLRTTRPVGCVSEIHMRALINKAYSHAVSRGYVACVITGGQRTLLCG